MLWSLRREARGPGGATVSLDQAMPASTVCAWLSGCQSRVPEQGPRGGWYASLMPPVPCAPRSILCVSPRPPGSGAHGIPHLLAKCGHRHLWAVECKGLLAGLKRVPSGCSTLESEQQSGGQGWPRSYSKPHISPWTHPLLQGTWGAPPPDPHLHGHSRIDWAGGLGRGTVPGAIAVVLRAPPRGQLLPQPIKGAQHKTLVPSGRAVTPHEVWYFGHMSSM